MRLLHRGLGVLDPRPPATETSTIERQRFMKHNRHSPWLSLLLLLPASAGSRAEEPGATEIQEAFAKAAGDYVILREGSERPLKLHETPVLKWSNPARSDEQGLVFVWQDDGLPLAIGSFFTFNYRGLRAKHEFHSLTDLPLSATFRGKAAWAPNKAGVTWKVLEDVGAPSRSKSLRLTQMKDIAGRFDVQLINPDGDQRKLRLLRTPLHRFSAPSNGVADGAIFAYTIATDPEALVIVRAKGDRWEYAFARFHYWQLAARLKEELVWSVALDLGLETNRLGDEPHMNKVFSSFYPEADHLFRP